MKRYLAVVPYCGNYESVHNMALDDALSQMFSDRDTGCHINDELLSRAQDSMNWRKCFLDYAKEYTEDFARWLDLDLKFGRLDSPKFYNFESDLLMASISEASLLKAYGAVDKELLVEVARRRHTSYDGFISFFSPDVSTWGPPQEWEAQQICTLLQALAEDTLGGDFDGWQQYDLMEHTRGNGLIDDILYRSCPEMERLLRIHDYLQAREERERETA